MKNNLKVIILIGISGAGKSTWAKNFIAKNENYVRVSRDEFRYMLKNQQICENKIENLITELCEDVIIKSLVKKQNVIIDNTNLKLKYINNFIKLVQDYADIEYILFDTSVEKCIERDKNREKQVGEKIINKMNNDLKILKENFNFQYVKKNKTRKIIKPDFNSELPNVICFDIDGTLALMGDRSPYDWDKISIDSLNEIVAEQIEFHRYMKRKIIILSGRDSSCKELTEKWLKTNGIKYDYIFMRKENDFRKDSIIKKELYEENIKDKFNLLCVYDDRISIIKMWAELGIFCFSVNQDLKFY